MAVAAVVEDHVHDNFQSFRVSVVDEAAVVGVGAEARVNAVVVGGGIAVVGRHPVLFAHVVFEDRGEPEGCHAQLVEIVEMLTHAFQVAAMTQRGLRAVDGIRHAGLLFAVVGTPLREAVGHEHIQHIRLGEAAALLAWHLALAQLVVDGEAFLAELYVERHHARLCVFQVGIDKEIVWRIETDQRIDCHAGIGGGDLCVAYAGGGDENLHRGVFHADIPMFRFDVRDFQFRCCCHVECEDEQQCCCQCSFHRLLFFS